MTQISDEEIEKLNAKAQAYKMHYSTTTTGAMLINDLLCTITQLRLHINDLLSANTQLRGISAAAEKERNEALFSSPPAPPSAEVVEKVALVLYNEYRKRCRMNPVDNIGANQTPVCNAFRFEASSAIAALTALGWKEPQ